MSVPPKYNFNIIVSIKTPEEYDVLTERLFETGYSNAKNFGNLFYKYGSELCLRLKDRRINFDRIDFYKKNYSETFILSVDEYFKTYDKEFIRVNLNNRVIEILNKVGEKQ